MFFSAVSLGFKKHKSKYKKKTECWVLIKLMNENANMNHIEWSKLEIKE